MKKNLSMWLLALMLMIIICYALLFISEKQFPTLSTSNGVVAIISAFIGVLLTVLVTNLLLAKQSENETLKEKDIKIYERKIDAYAKFVAILWRVVGDGKIERTEMEELRHLCFEQLVFYLEQEEIKTITAMIRNINCGKRKDDAIIVDDAIQSSIATITSALQNNLKNSKKDFHAQKVGLQNLFNAFTKEQENAIKI